MKVLNILFPHNVSSTLCGVQWPRRLRRMSGDALRALIVIPYLKKYIGRMTMVIITFSFLLTITQPALANCDANTVKAEVNGLVCDFCARALEKVFGKQEAVKDIDVNLDDGVITIQLNDGQTLDDTTINQLIHDAGYNVTTIKKGC